MARLTAWTLFSLTCSTIAIGCGGHSGGGGGENWVTDRGTGDGGFTPSATHRYRLARAPDSLLAPLPDPAWFTYDGSHYWFSYGLATKRGARLVELDPTTSTVVRDITVPPLLLESPNAFFGAIAWDGEALWIGSGGVGASIFRVGTSGEVDRSWRTQENSGPTGLAADGTTLWISSGGGTVYAIDATDGRLRSTFEVMEHYRRQVGIAHRTGEIWIAAMFGGLDVYDPATGARFGGVGSKEGVAEDDFLLGSIAFVGPRLGSLQGSRVVLYDIEMLP
jgi:outer membrane protein assembly factor BamB